MIESLTSFVNHSATSLVNRCRPPLYAPVPDDNDCSRMRMLSAHNPPADSTRCLTPACNVALRFNRCDTSNHNTTLAVSTAPGPNGIISSARRRSTRLSNNSNARSSSASQPASTGTSENASMPK